MDEPTRQLNDARKREAATREILRAISRLRTDYAPVFQIILDNATRLCGAPFGALFLLRGNQLHVVADAGSEAEMIEHLRANPIPLDDPVALVSRTARAREPLHMHDVMDKDYHADDSVRVTSVSLGGIRTAFCVPMLKGDERKLKQILLNLLSNAIKFTGEGGTVTLEARQDDTHVHIGVRDAGIGISKRDQAVIFEEFKQVGTDYARKGEGTGLGFTLTRRFVEMHGGHITVTSEPGAGSVFNVVLPLRAAEQAA